MSASNLEYVRNRLAALHQAGLSEDEIIAKIESEPEIALLGAENNVIILIAKRTEKLLQMKNGSGIVIDEQPLLPHVEFIIQQMALMQLSEVSLREKIDQLQEQVTHFQVNRLPNIPFTNAAYNADQRLCGSEFDNHRKAPLEVLIGGYHHTGKTLVEAILIDGLSKYGFNNVKRIHPEEPIEVLDEILKGLNTGPSKDDASVAEFFNKEIRINANIHPSKPRPRMSVTASPQQRIKEKGDETYF